jgi:hypothetical protein
MSIVKNPCFDVLLVAVLVGACNSPKPAKETPPPPAEPSPPPEAAAVVPAAAVGDAALAADPCRPTDEAMREHMASLMPAAEAKKAVEAEALEVRDAIAREDFAALAGHVGPGKGVCLAASKGATCRWMTAAELRTCRTSKRREEWDIDTGSDEPAPLTCRDVFRKVFFAHPGLAKAAPAFNCFPDRGDNNSASIINPEAGGGIYVDFFAAEVEPVKMAADGTPVGHESWRSLWLTFARSGDRHQLVAITSHYWGI